MRRSILFLVIGIFTGGIISHWAGRMIPSAAAAPKRLGATAAGTLKYPLHATLYRFTLNKANRQSVAHYLSVGEGKPWGAELQRYPSILLRPRRFR